jgi:hypothetical protein
MNNTPTSTHEKEVIGSNSLYLILSTIKGVTLPTLALEAQKWK